MSGDLRVVTFAERPDLREAVWEVNQAGWPEFMLHDAVADEHFGKLYDRFPEYQFALLDGEGRICVTGNCIPFRWDAPIQHLPDGGWDFVLEQGVVDHQLRREPNMVSAIQVVVRRDLAGTGLSHRGLEAMRAIVRKRGIGDLVAPVRPNVKHRYPLTPMERYATWTRADGALLDPWLRVHQRAGGTLIRVCPRSMTIRGTVADWEEWTGLALPESGDYVVAGALNPVQVDRAADRCTYVEPNVWMHHRLG